MFSSILMVLRDDRWRLVEGPEVKWVEDKICPVRVGEETPKTKTDAQPRKIHKSSQPRKEIKNSRVFVYKHIKILSKRDFYDCCLFFIAGDSLPLRWIIIFHFTIFCCAQTAPKIFFLHYLLFKIIKMFIGPRDAMLPGNFGASQRATCFQGMLRVIMQFYAVIISQKPSQVSLDSFMDIRGSFFSRFLFLGTRRWILGNQVFHR